MPDIDSIIIQFINSRLAPEEQRRRLLELGLDAELVEEAFSEFRKRASGRRWMYPPPMLVDPSSASDSWYLGADSVADAKFWPALKRYLRDTKNWPDPAIDSIHEASDRIVAWLQSPTAAQIKTRGLVVGYVQSGKTANFTAVISKAADVGYRFFIVLSGTKNALRSQTQRRLNRELIDLNPRYWYSPTSVERDFLANSDIGNATFFLSERRDDKVLCVVKKNATVLKRLTKWLKSATPEVLKTCPFLIIDDEADEASINTAPGQAYSDPEDANRTAINRRLVELLKLLPKAAYVGYTATPFANVLIDPRYEDDLYPRDFIVSLPKPKGHFGTEDIFGRERLLQDKTDEEFQGIDVVRIVPAAEIPALKPPSRSSQNFVFSVTQSLADALHYFWMATAARRLRGQTAEHSTMLVHTSERIEVHNRTRDQLELYRNTFLRQMRSQESASILAALAGQWEDEMRRIRPVGMDTDLPPVTFNQLAAQLVPVVEATAIVVDNSQSSYRLSYEGESRVQVAVGGNTLARGLTLEGLVVSFFVRSAGAYDTLLQMGRWFGYRPGYEDLPRIWMTQELRNYFFDLSTVEAEVREDVERYAERKMTPREFGVRIRQHPSLSITAPLKMQHAVSARVSFSADKHQTVLFEHRNADWLEKNIRVASSLVERLIQEQGAPQALNGHQVFFSVPVRYVLDFLSGYQFHESSRPLDSKLLTRYIKNQNTYGSLRQWNVVVRGVKGKDKKIRGTMVLGPLQVPLLERARRATPSDYANIGVLMSKGDIGADLTGLQSTDGLTDKKIIELRQQRMSDTGLLIIYPIAKDSQVGRSASENQSRVPLDAVADVIGLGLVLPPAAPQSGGEQSYVTVDPAKLYGGDIELVDEDTGDE